LENILPNISEVWDNKFSGWRFAPDSLKLRKQFDAGFTSENAFKFCDAPNKSEIEKNLDQGVLP